MKIGCFSEKHYTYIVENLQGTIDQLVSQNPDDYSILRDITYELKMLDYEAKENHENLKDIDIIVSYYLSNEHFQQMDSLKVVILPMTGLDNLGSEVLKAEGLKIINAHSTAPYIAERGFAILMTLLGRIVEQDAALKNNQWFRRPPKHTWTTLHNKKVGIYGYGHIGKLFRQMILPFNPDIYIIDRQKDYTVLPHEKPINLVKDLDELTKISDILFIATPANEYTICSISEKEILNMNDGFFINVGRGKIVDQKALYKALENNILKGYGSDVWYNYPKNESDIVAPADYDMGKFNNVVMTPHNAWNMDHKKGLVEQEVVDNIIDILITI